MILRQIKYIFFGLLIEFVLFGMVIFGSLIGSNLYCGVGATKDCAIGILAMAFVFWLGLLVPINLLIVILLNKKYLVKHKGKEHQAVKTLDRLLLIFTALIILVTLYAFLFVSGLLHTMLLVFD